jgi:hypothetical protein
MLPAGVPNVRPWPPERVGNALSLGRVAAVSSTAVARAILPRPTKPTLLRVILVFMCRFSVGSRTSTRKTTRSARQK